MKKQMYLPEIGKIHQKCFCNKSFVKPMQAQNKVLQHKTDASTKQGTAVLPCRAINYESPGHQKY